MAQYSRNRKPRRLSLDEQLAWGERRRWKRGREPEAEPEPEHKPVPPRRPKTEGQKIAAQLREEHRQLLFARGAFGGSGSVQTINYDEFQAVLERDHDEGERAAQVALRRGAASGWAQHRNGHWDEPRPRIDQPGAEVFEALALATSRIPR